jgi:hypothetical protein
VRLLTQHATRIPQYDVEQATHCLQRASTTATLPCAPCVYVDLSSHVIAPSFPAFRTHIRALVATDFGYACHLCTGNGPTPVSSAPGLGSAVSHLHCAPGLVTPLPHLRRTGLTHATSALGVGPSPPHLHRDRLTASTFAQGVGSPLPHLHRDCAHRFHSRTAGLG